MAIGSRAQKNQSFVFAAKNNSAWRRAFLIFSLFATQCTHSPKTQKRPLGSTTAPLPSKEAQPTGKQLTKTGINDSPSWSQDNNRFLFVSRQRLGHKGAQIYEWDLSTNEERRVTYSDGDSFDPRYLEDQKSLIYASTTDEIKERPELFKKSVAKDQLPPSELYTSELNGLDIRRLTQRPGYDGKIKESAWENEFYFTAQTNGVSAINKIQVLEGNPSTIFNDSNSKSEDPRTEFTSIEQRFAWVTMANDEPHLMVSEKNIKTPTSIRLGATTIKDLTWIPSAKSEEALLLMTLTFKDQKISQIYVYDIRKNCLARIVKSDRSELSQGSLSPDRRRLLFVSNEEADRSQIFLKTIEWEKIVCERTPEVIIK